MKLREASWNEFVSSIKQQNQKVVVYGAGVIGKITLPMYIEDQQLEASILFIADADPHKSGGFIRIGNRDIAICPPEKMKSIQDKFVILVTGSRYEAILRYLEQVEELSKTDVYIFPQMLVKECRIFKKIEIAKKFSQPLIPKVIHYCWFGRSEMPDRLKKCQESWVRYCPDYQIVEWNEDNYDVEKHTYARQAYHCKKLSYVSDVARLEILYENGGIYLDTDVELIRSLDELLYQPGFIGVEKWGVVNSGGGCGVRPRHPMIGKMLECRLDVPFKREDGSLNLETSGSFESKPLLEYGFRPDNTLQTVGDLTVYPSDFFHPFDYMSKELCVTENTYGIHHFMGSWV